MKRTKANKNVVTSEKGITLLALVVTIIVLLILARDKYSNGNRAIWDNKYGKKCSR